MSEKQTLTIDTPAATAATDMAAITAAAIAQEEALARRYEEDQESERSVLERTLGLENALSIWQRRVEVMAKIRQWAIADTQPENWTLNGDLATPGAAACDTIAIAYGIYLVDIGPRGSDGNFSPIKIVEGMPEGHYGYRAFATARSALLKRSVYVEATRSSFEQFAGRLLDIDTGKVVRDREKGTQLDSDLRASTLTLLRTKGVKMLTGITAVPISILKKAGLNPDLCAKGHGYGSAAERAAQAVADADAPAAAEGLWKDILARTGGDAEAAKGLLKEVTSSDNFAGHTDWKRMTKGWQVGNAKKKLAAHKVFGDQKKSEVE